jgi:beta-lactam-binding protein with PASTA domain
MRKVLMIVLVIVLIWVGYVTAEYFRVYRPDNTDNKVLISLGEKDTDTYVEQKGLGFSVVKYKVSLSDAESGTLIKEFKIFGIKVSKTTLVRVKK